MRSRAGCPTIRWMLAGVALAGTTGCAESIDGPRPVDLVPPTRSGWDDPPLSGSVFVVSSLFFGNCEEYLCSDNQLSLLFNWRDPASSEFCALFQRSAILVVEL